MSAFTENTPAPSDRPSPSASPIVLGPILVYGFAAVVAMWCAWLLVHTPGLDAPPAVVAITLILALVATTFTAGWSVARGGAPSIAWKVGGGAGCLAAIITLLILASHLVEQATPGSAPAAGFSGLRPSALLYVPGFLVGAMILGSVSALAGSFAGHRPAPPDGLYAGHGHWLGRFSLVTAAATLPVIVLGGFVTSTAAGMAVTGWPDSYGANMFLFPISLMSEPRIFLEHSHRLFGSMAGLCVVSLMVYALRVERRPAVKWWIVGLFIVVCIQGVLGGLRVVHNRTDLAIVHGVLGQLFFAMAATACVHLSASYRLLETARPPADLPEDESRLPRRRRVMSTALLHLLMVQLVMGAWFRHTGKLHPLYTHIAIALAIVVIGFVAGMLLRWTRDVPDRTASLMRRVGMGILVCLALQFVLGWAAFATVLTGPAKGPVPLAHELGSVPTPPVFQALIATAHQANGAVLIGLAAGATALARAASRRS